MKRLGIRPDLQRRFHDVKRHASTRVSEWVVQTFLNFIATEIHKNFITPERHDGVAANFLSKTAAGQQATRVLVSPRLAYVNRALCGRNYLIGDSFTAPDAYLFVMLTWAQRLELDLSPWRNLSDYFERIAAMPSVC